MQSPSFGNFGVINRDRGTGNDNIRAGNVRASVSLESRGAQCREPLYDRRTFQVGPGNLIPKIQQHLGNTAHADPTDAHEMKPLNPAEHENQAPSLNNAS